MCPDGEGVSYPRGESRSVGQEEARGNGSGTDASSWDLALRWSLTALVAGVLLSQVLSRTPVIGSGFGAIGDVMTTVALVCTLASAAVCIARRIASTR